ncbi:(LSU ribosomal protein L11P)-lysine N-methyltransferase [Spongiibacter sp. IMCC21906]|jgi:ribosomal protein L11 methyltransferase|uniref:50S ribosomal protein L11 methyltransferase n=1 Tax=Spongiibacter sp. IMCC21906 TaxID=1620392 RepID=UPI00062DD385|nr:50S ribosomal protein L11 methyltransferase [Spongiibacter sp. IMCC21906]AKH69000.1 (LSU ribosomal protein L11P)-lysine N-methyltransferase [Spongiibacter sp. IMCC21906]
MTWLQLRLDADPSSASELEDALMEIGASAVTMEDDADQPLYEPPIGETPVWQHTRVTGLFPADTDMESLLPALAAFYGQALPPHRTEILEDRDWIREWMDSYQPLQCGNNLWICPSWREPVDPDAVNVLLDPGLAFGTGTHPTTWLCLQWLDSQAIAGKTVIDYGCGSGILGIAALLLGANRLICIDSDPQALLATRENARRNDIDETKIQCLLPDEFDNNVQADVLLANILAGPLLQLAPRLTGLVKNDGLICLSGILDTQGEQLLECYGNGFRELSLTSKEEWVRISGIKTN